MQGSDPTSIGEAFISLGLLEDRIFNKFFGHGDNETDVSDDKKGNMTVRMEL